MTMPQSVRKVDGGKLKGAQPVPNCIEVKFQVALGNGKQTFSAVHGRFASPPANLQTLANALFTSFSSAWSTNLAPQMSPNASFTNVFIRDMTNVNNPVFQGTGTAVPGTAVGSDLPQNVAGVMTENINSRGKGLKGRVFLGGWSTFADAGNGQMTTAAKNAITNFGSAIFSALNAQSLTPCIAQVARQAYTGITGTPHLARTANSGVNVTSYAARDAIWDTQRRRIQTG